MTNARPAIRLSTLRQIAPYLSMRGVSPLEFFRRFGISPMFFKTLKPGYRERTVFILPTKWPLSRRIPSAGG